ncbi:diguanylate cyclase (GGDEF)-like protein [Pseudomonas sp. SJZ079]|uniref:GGDEF domain-containing protein n=1 Tax=Pseudomonas sp. SJZ079 TaxID=2572887 RepID=UPI00119C5AB9|nr:GGDEF domain-containing protein [Pseudomonas sp. SJZ079]TWC31677.1 diguanylate cyclase (GGDEF)-like protein [Pseudomonas sp. SJZ079]
MTHNELPHDPATFTLWREAQDIRARSHLAGFYYLIAWLLVWIMGGEPTAQFTVGLAGTAFFGLFLLLRLVNRLPEQYTPRLLQGWLNRQWALILLGALGWGLALGWTLYSPDFKGSRVIAMMATIAFSTASVYHLAMRKHLSLLILPLLYLPGLLALALDWQEQRGHFIALIAYLSYLIFALNRNRQVYQNHLAMELKLLEQQESLEILSRTDSLTQLGNRYHFNSLFPAMVANAQRQSNSLSLVLLDIDYFKQINDAHGHACGDACLSAFAELMRQVFRRDSDALLRLGGEEFGVLMPGTSLEQAHLLAESFRQELAQHGFSVQGQNLPLTSSLGVGCFDKHRDVSAEAFFKRVDDALYRAKNAGRNCLILASVA